MFSSVTDALEIHINHAEFWDRIPSMGRRESKEISAILKVNSDISNTQPRDILICPISRLRAETLKGDLKLSVSEDKRKQFT